MTLCTVSSPQEGDQHTPSPRKQEGRGRRKAGICSAVLRRRTVVLCHIPQGSWFLAADRAPLALQPCPLHPYSTLLGIDTTVSPFLLSSNLSLASFLYCGPLALVTHSQSGNAAGSPGSKPRQSFLRGKPPATPHT